MTAKTLGAFLLGGAVGAGLGVLFAPDKGSITRKNIMTKKDKLVEDAESKINEGKDYVKDKVQEGKDYVNDKVKEGKDYVKSKFEDGKEKLSDLNVKAREKADGVTDDFKKSKQGGYTPSGV